MSSVKRITCFIHNRSLKYSMELRPTIFSSLPKNFFVATPLVCSMSRLDLVVFGATGFTGKKAVEEVVRVTKKYPGLTWGVAGRSQAKLERLKAEIMKKTGYDLSSIRIIIAEVKNEASIKRMCKQAKVIANCCGPYNLYGEPVVKAAITAKTHVVDISGEPQYIQTMQLKYDQAAREAGIYVVSACGFDSIPNDMGLVYMQQNFDGTLNSVESYLSVDVAAEYHDEVAKNGILSSGTWESTVIGISQFYKLPALEKALYPERLPNLKPNLKLRLIHKHNGKFCLPFPGTDARVKKTQHYLYKNDHKRPVQFKPYLKLPSFYATVLTTLVAIVLFLMSITPLTRKLLLKYPSFFSAGMMTQKGPTENVMKTNTFMLELFGEGWEKGADVDAVKPTKKAIVRVKGVNPFYGATATMLVYSAITCLKEHEKMPSTGGVLTPGIAFGYTDLIKNLNENNVTFEYVQMSTLN